MDDLHKALGDISSIRRQMARSTEFRGYGPWTMAITGLCTVVAGTTQAFLVPSPASQIMRYLAVWIVTAIVCATLSGIQMHSRSRRMHSSLSDEMINQAVEQFIPSVGAGALVTTVLVTCVPNAVWMLPGLWQVMFSLGIFASCRFLPRKIIFAAAWYLLCGLVCLSLADVRAFSPYAMAVPFGVGQLIVAAILYVANAGGSDEA
ncbi:conserved hypothetical protein [Candidatus Koribacter versatilis Ellin345]|uniref:Transmembrane protein n=1 Tax=Koribacter versatilis (strain Ellin345) TaxID=204669 RepID=Q1ILW1_KORVE|nr:hypothetical protein [Candidatus Koribacter versatilis]ABF42139.1 conserved hypothetical protein [Candidatus Koribacter versatilis Ellin345]